MTQSSRLLHFGFIQALILKIAEYGASFKPPPTHISIENVLSSKWSRTLELVGGFDLADIIYDEEELNFYLT